VFAPAGTDDQYLAFPCQASAVYTVARRAASLELTGEERCPCPRE